MDNQKLSVEVFARSLTEDQMNICESDEARLAEIFQDGWSEANAVRFHRAMLRARTIESNATVDGVFELALQVGLDCVARLDLSNLSLSSSAKLKQRGVRGVGVSGNKRGRSGVSIKEA